MEPTEQTSEQTSTVRKTSIIDLLEEDAFCPVCGCAESLLIGRLGTMEHYCCRACGMTFSREADHA
jgi:Zn ribbon nucleic-acid-binding protein